ncbi:MAG TPA: M2 family metallopeptidase [Candidatus Polarisedimenticolia bacterium]|nr:M2 family metallopeptidase [Candidatus Polarisedimenticolia bacterium]
MPPFNAARQAVRRLTVSAAALLCLAAPAEAAAAPPTVQEARAFIEETERRLTELTIAASRAQWVQSTYITHDTEILAAEAGKNLLAAQMQAAKDAARFRDLDLPSDLKRRIQLLRTSMAVAAPADPAKQAELATLLAEMESIYGRGEYCPQGGECMDINALSRVLAESRDPARLLDVWAGWRTIAPPLRPMYKRFVELGNEGARELGFADLGALWRSGYDMPPEAFAAELDRLWAQVRPLYDALHCHVRASLSAQYGESAAPAAGPIPAHLLGNMWSQSWINIYDLVGVPEGGGPGFDLTRLLRERGIDPVGMVRYGERFFTSLGLEPLPDTFWERSLFVKPGDRDVVCHASAWDVDLVDDLRIKMCIEINDEDFSTVHHELGHLYYDRAYNKQPMIYRQGANDGFHEGVGDTLALSITPEYLVEIGLLDKVPGESGDLGLLMKMALDKVAFLPFGLLVDQWRWKVFSGEIGPGEYNQAWWDLRLKYQGIQSAVPRSEADFDPGAKYHVPANTPYSRYFLASILQFQFHRALCEAAGEKGPLHRCSIYGNKEAGRRLAAMLEMGASRPWPEALASLTGESRMDATAILDYFAPLKEWLDRQNSGRQCGW